LDKSKAGLALPVSPWHFAHEFVRILFTSVGMEDFGFTTIESFLTVWPSMGSRVKLTKNKPVIKIFGSMNVGFIALSF
jgi:hypothetical protein